MGRFRVNSVSWLPAIVFGVLPLLQDQKPAGQTPVPAPQAVTEAKKLVRDLYKEDFAKKAPADRQALAMRLREQARAAKEDPATQFALYAETQDLFMGLGDLDNCLALIEEIGGVFATDPRAQQAAVLQSLAKSAKTPDELRKIAQGQFKLVDAAIRADELPTAEKSLQDAAASARKASDVSLVSKAAVKAKDLAEIKAQSDKCKKARETLQSAPEDPASNLLMGKYHGFVRGNWEMALPFLAKSADETLRSVAGQDTASPSEAPAQLKIADGWWTLSDKESGMAKANLRLRALDWYRKAQPTLQGIDKTRVEKRILDGHLDWLNQWTWLPLTDPNSFGLLGKKGDVFDATWEQMGAHVQELRPFPQGSFDGFTIHVVLHATVPSVCTVRFDQKLKEIVLEPGMAKTAVSESPVTALGMRYKNTLHPYPGKLDFYVTVLAEGNEWTAYIDGLQVSRMAEAKESSLSTFDFTVAGKMKIDQVRFRRK